VIDGQRLKNGWEATMPGTYERSIEELYAQDPERADTMVFGRKSGLDRRGFLGGAGLAAVGAAVGGAIPFAANMPGGLIPAALAQSAPAAAPPKGPQYLKFPGKDDKLVLLGDRPLVAETPEHLLDDDTTPTPRFFVRNNGLIPEENKEPDKWKITIDGEVNNKIEITLGELKTKFKPVTQRMVLECGGNGRSFFTPTARGNQWTNGGAGCAEWTGVRLSDRPLRQRPEPRRRQQGRDLARRADQEGNGQQQPHRVRDERAAAVEHSRRAGASRHSGLAGLSVVQVVQPALGSRQISRRPRHGRDLVPRRHPADGAGRQAGGQQLPRFGIDAGALDCHQPGER
jgi:hypothetical protein